MCKLNMRCNVSKGAHPPSADIRICIIIQVIKSIMTNTPKQIKPTKTIPT
jgi:hypothetical protein